MKRFLYFIIPLAFLVAAGLILFLKPVEKEKKDVAQLNDAGVFHLDHNRIDLAIRAFEQAIKIDPSYGPAVENLGLAYYRKKDYEKASEYLIRAMKLVPDSPTLYNTLGSLYREKKLYNEAIKYYQRSMELDRSFFDPLYNLALTYEDMGNRQKAIETWEVYLKATENNPAEKEYRKVAEERLRALKIRGMH